MTVASVHRVKTNFVCVFASFGVGHLVSTLVVGAHIGNAAFLPYLIFFFSKNNRTIRRLWRASRSTKFRLLTFSSSKLVFEKKSFFTPNKTFVGCVNRPECPYTQSQVQTTSGGQKKMESTCFIVSTVWS